MPGIVWIAIIGGIAGIIARFLLPGSNNPQGFLLTITVAAYFLRIWDTDRLSFFASVLVSDIPMTHFRRVHLLMSFASW